MPRNFEADTTTDAVVTETLEEDIRFSTRTKKLPPHSANCGEADKTFFSRVKTAKEAIDVKHSNTMQGSAT